MHWWFVFIVGAGTLIGTPIELLAGTYLAEYGRYSRFAFKLPFFMIFFFLTPSIITGLFCFTAYMYQSSIWWAGAFA